MNNSFSAEGQTFQYKSVTTSTNVQKTNNVEFQDAVQRYELRRSSRQRQSGSQQPNVITTKYVQLDDDRKINELEGSRYSQRVVEKYATTTTTSQNYDVNRQSVKEVMDKYRRGRGSQMTTTEVKQVAVPQYEPIQQKETVFENRNSYDEQQERQVILNYNTITSTKILEIAKQQAYDEDFEQIKEDCHIGDQYRRPEREDDVQVDLLESDYVSCKIF